MRETRLSGSEGGAGSIPVPTPIVAWAFQPMSGRRAEDGGGLAHGTHGTHGKIFDRRERSDRRAEGGGRMGRSVHPWLINLECWAAADSRLKDLP